MADAIQMLNAAESDSQWFSDNLAEIREEYGGRLVAVKDETIVAAGDRFDEVKVKLSQKGIDPSNTLIERVVESKTYIIR